MNTVGAFEAKNKLGSLLDRVGSRRRNSDHPSRQTGWSTFPPTPSTIG